VVEVDAVALPALLGQMRGSAPQAMPVIDEKR
jgi:hypothetical protein